MNLKKVKYWNVLANNVSMADAINALEKQNWNGNKVKDLSIRIKYRVFTDKFEIQHEKFSVEEATSNNWEIIIPDDGSEKKLEDLRDLVKESNILSYDGTGYAEIDNMDISDIYNAIDNFFVIQNDDMKIRLVKAIINQKLYKKM